MRPLGKAAFGLAPAVLVGLLVLGGSARAGLSRQEGTPAPAAPVVTVEATNVVTLVARYLLDPSGQFLSLTPLQTGGDVVAGFDPASGQSVGQVDFPPDNGLPTITLGESTFTGYLRYEGDINNGLRWTWFDDEEGTRPATLVVQVSGQGGAYQDYFGTATFVSRDDGNAGGVLVLALRPPTSGNAAVAATQPPAEVVAPTATSAPPPATVVLVQETAPAAETPAEPAATEAPTEDADPTGEPLIGSDATEQPAEETPEGAAADDGTGL